MFQYYCILFLHQIGSGHGKFACLVLQHLLEMREFMPTLVPRQARPSLSQSPPPTMDSETDVTDTGDKGHERPNIKPNEMPATDGVIAGSEAGSKGDWGGGGVDGLPFRYVVTDVAQVRYDICCRYCMGIEDGIWIRIGLYCMCPSFGDCWC